MEKNLIQIESIKAAIKFRYGSLVGYAEKIGVSKQTLEHKIKTQSSKFMFQLRQDGILVDDPNAKMELRELTPEYSAGELEEIKKENLDLKNLIIKLNYEIIELRRQLIELQQK